MHHTFLIHYGELGLKGKNRKDFENRLLKNITDKLRRKGLDVPMTMQHRYLTIELPDEKHIPTVCDLLSKTFGISWFAIAETLPRDTDQKKISAEVLTLAKTHAAPEITFRISAKRADKSFPLTSGELERAIGAEVLQKTKHSSVNLSAPDHTYFIEINHSHIFIFDRRLSGPGGLPIGSSGKALALLSGGFDSPVAAYLMAKRGCTIDFLNFFVNEPGKTDKVPRLASKLSKYTGHGRLYLAPYLPFNMAILDAESNYELVLFRRFMLRVGEKLAKKYGYDLLITGDSLGQVASQTVENIHATEDALEEALCLRPLIGMDKEEIITIARNINLFDIAREPENDCCSLIDRHPKTKVTLEKIREEEKKIAQYDRLIEETLKEIIVLPH